MGLAIAAAGTRLGPAHGALKPDAPAAVQLPAVQQSLIQKTLDIAGQNGRLDTFEFLLGRWIDTHARQITVTPVPLAELMTEIASLLAPPRPKDPYTVLDPACGTGGLLLAAAARCGTAGPRPGAALTLLGQDRDPVLAALAASRLQVASSCDTGDPQEREKRQNATSTADIRTGDTLRADPHAQVLADIVLCNPPFNERDWGHEELATDSRWTYGLPSRTESELAWVQHALSRLTPGGAAVLLLPPAVAARKAGRRIRAALLRSGALRAVVALPAGCAAPFSIALQLWVLQAPPLEPGAARRDLLLIDATHVAADPDRGASRTGIDWASLRERVLNPFRAYCTESTERDALPDGSALVPTIDLLDDHVDLTPARYVPSSAGSPGTELRQAWAKFGASLHELGDLTALLSQLDLEFVGPSRHSVATVGDLVRAGALTLRGGQAPAEGTVRGGDPAPTAVPVLTLANLTSGSGTTGWLPAAQAAAGHGTGALTVTELGDVVVVGVARVFDVWVESSAPTALGPQLYVLRVDPALFDPWFLAGCLRAPANARQADTHSSTTSKIEIRRLQVLPLPLHEQRRYGEAFRRVAAFERALREAGGVGAELVRGLSDGLAAGGLPQNE